MTDALRTSVMHCTAIASRLPMTIAMTAPAPAPDGPPVCPSGSNVPPTSTVPTVSGIDAMDAAKPNISCTSSRMPKVRQKAPRVRRHDWAAAAKTGRPSSAIVGTVNTKRMPSHTTTTPSPSTKSTSASTNQPVPEPAAPIVAKTPKKTSPATIAMTTPAAVCTSIHATTGQRRPASSAHSPRNVARRPSTRCPVSAATGATRNPRPR